MRYLAIDFGERRIGLALSDVDGRLATPLGAIARTSDAQAVAEIARIARQEEIEGLVLGEPRRLDGVHGEAAARTAAFGAKLMAATGLACERVDEALTSFAAGERLREAGVARHRRRGLLDAVAAQIMLQEFLDARGGQR